MLPQGSLQQARVSSPRAFRLVAGFCTSHKPTMIKPLTLPALATGFKQQMQYMVLDNTRCWDRVLAVSALECSLGFRDPSCEELPVTVA